MCFPDLIVSPMSQVPVMPRWESRCEPSEKTKSRSLPLRLMVVMVLFFMLRSVWRMFCFRPEVVEIESILKGR